LRKRISEKSWKKLKLPEYRQTCPMLAGESGASYNYPTIRFIRGVREFDRCWGQGGGEIPIGVGIGVRVGPALQGKYGRTPKQAFCGGDGE